MENTETERMFTMIIKNKQEVREVASETVLDLDEDIHPSLPAKRFYGTAESWEGFRVLFKES